MRLLIKSGDKEVRTVCLFEERNQPAEYQELSQAEER